MGLVGKQPQLAGSGLSGSFYDFGCGPVLPVFRYDCGGLLLFLLRLRSE